MNIQIGWIVLDPEVKVLDWIGSGKMDQCITLIHSALSIKFDTLAAGI